MTGNREQHRKSSSKYYYNNKEKALQACSDYYYRNIDKTRKVRRDYYYHNKDKMISQVNERNTKHRRIVLDYYSNGKFECACCKEKQYEFLSIDHIIRVEKSEYKTGGKLYRFLIKTGFPTGFQVLCMNCNWGRRFTGICPHNKIKQINNKQLLK